MSEPIQSESDEIRRIDFSGTAWLASVLVANAVFVSTLILRGWRVTSLPSGSIAWWWIGALVAVAATAALAWAGCPVLRNELSRVDRRKALTIRLGIVAYLIGAILVVGSLII